MIADENADWKAAVRRAYVAGYRAALEAAAAKAAELHLYGMIEESNVLSHVDRQVQIYGAWVDEEIRALPVPPAPGAGKE